jgi:hypothetical protein
MLRQEIYCLARTSFLTSSIMADSQNAREGPWLPLGAPIAVSVDKSAHPPQGSLKRKSEGYLQKALFSSSFSIFITSYDQIWNIIVDDCKITVSDSDSDPVDSPEIYRNLSIITIPMLR